MRLVDVDKVKKHLDENKPDWTAEDYAVACEDAEFYSSMEDFIAEHDDEIEMMMFAPELVPDEPHWIPCSERLPEKTGYYLVWTDSEIVDISEFYTFADFVQKEIAKNYWNKESKILYWMPLPEPPEEVQNDD